MFENLKENDLLMITDVPLWGAVAFLAKQRKILQH